MADKEAGLYYGLYYKSYILDKVYADTCEITTDTRTRDYICSSF